MERLEDLKFGRQQAMVIDFLYEMLGLEPMGHIQIAPLLHVWQECWMAFVPVAVTKEQQTQRMAALIGYRNGYIRVLAFGLCDGFRPNGNMETSGFGDLRDILYGFFSQENLKEDCYRSPLTCMGNPCNSTASNCVECNAS